jgi:vacuolar-type H+-ATPase subunit H
VDQEEAMGDIIDYVLKAEQRAEALLSEARSRDTELKKAADKELSTMQEEASQKAQQLVEARLKEAQKEADRAYQEAVAQAEEENRRFLNTSKGQLEKIVGTVVEYITTPEYKRE